MPWRWVAVALALMLVGADGAAAQSTAKVTVKGPASVVAGGTATFTVGVRPTRAALRTGKLTLLLSTDRKRDGKDKRVATGTVRKVKKGKTAQVKLRAKVSAKTAARRYYALACLTVGKRTTCVNRRVTVRAAAKATTPATPAPTPAPPAASTPAPATPQAPAPTATATPAPTATAVPPVVINAPAPAPGPTDAAAPDPAAAADPLPSESTSSHKAATEFLYTGADPIQKGVAAGTIKATRSAVLRGRVSNRMGGGIGGVRVSVEHHPELGFTTTRADGGYDIAVNGGGELALSFEREGYIPGQRRVDAPWQDYADVEDIVLVPYDTRATQLDTRGGEAVAAQGSTVSDGLGARTQTLLFEPGTTAEMVVGGQVRQLGTSFTVRSTEFTIGAEGLDAMPGELPPTTAYTYAAEFSLDEAVAAGATEVRFSQPVVTYLDNFLDLPVGTLVPAGYYDRERNAWIGAPNGRVVKVVAGGVDTDGDGTADNTGLGATELAKVQELYTPGTELWRVAITHFTPWDYNYPYGPADDAEPPGPDVGPDDPQTPPCDPCKDKGSILLSEEQVLGEQLPVTGLGAALSYRSDDVPGRIADRRLRIRLVDGSLPESLEAIEVEIGIAGRTITQRFTRAEALADPVYTFVWDGEDAYGRSVQGTQTASVDVDYEYKAVYRAPEEFQSSWARLSGTPITGASSRGNYKLGREGGISLVTFDSRGVGLGGWTLTDNHRYDPQSGVLRLGSGESSGVEVTRLGVLDQVGAAGIDGATGLAIDATGALWIADTRTQRIRKRADDGTLTTVAGTGDYGFRPADDGGAATSARLSSPEAIAVVGDGEVAYVADTGANRIRRIENGTITTVAGGGTSLGDDGPATSARLRGPTGVAVAPDGTLYIADTGGNRVRMVGTDGRITTIAGTGAAAFGGDGGPAAEARLHAPSGLAFDRDGALLIADTGNARVRRVDADGTITTLAGGGTSRGDGGAATAARLLEPIGLALGRDGRVLIADALDGRVRAVMAGGDIRTVAGGGGETRAAGIPSTAVALTGPTGVAYAPDGRFLFSEPQTDRISVVQPPRPGFTEGDILVASTDGAQIFQFNLNGRHERTFDALTGATLRRFSYDAEGRLARVDDEAAGETTPHRPLLEIARTGTEITLTTRGGAVTQLELDANGWLKSVTNPAGDVHQLTHGETGLLTGETDAEGGTHSFAYDASGYLVSDTNPAGTEQTLERTELANGREVKLTQPGGRVTTYRGELDDEGTYTRSVTDAAGSTTVTRRYSNGDVDISYEDGMVVERRLAPDPRFGLQAPYVAREVTTTPSGKSSTATTTRTATMRDELRLERLVDTVVRDGATTTSTFQARPGDDGGVLTTVAPGGQTGTIDYDRRGRITSSKPASAAATTTFTYDDANDGRIATLARGERTWTYGYDARNRIVSRTDGEGEPTTYAYDDADRLLSTSTAGDTWGYTYDRTGRRTGLVAPGGRVSTSTLDAAGKVSSLAIPGTTAYERDYTALEEIDAHTLPSGAVTTSAYDAAGRPTGHVDRRSVAGAVVASTTLGYVGTTQRAGETTWTAGERSQDYDTTYDGSLPTQVSFGDAGSIATPVTATGLKVDALTIDAGAGAPVTYDVAYNAARRVTQVGPFTIGRSTTTGLAETYGDDGSELRNLDTRGFGELDERQLSRGETAKYALAVTRDKTGRVTRREETIDGGAAIVRSYAYDTRGRLVEVRDGGDDVVESYGYDAAGDRLSANGETATYDATTHRQTAAGATALSFDADGFLTARGADTFEYAPSGELLTATAGGVAVTYSYDALGRLVRRSTADGDTTFLYGNPENVFQLTATTDADDELTTYFFDDLGHLHAFERGGARYRVGSDQVGTPRVVIDGDGDVVKRIDRDSYGRVVADSAPAFALVVGFAGGIEDAATGLVRFGLRDYDPRTGRFTSQDPLFYAGSPRNLYAYAESQPTTLADPSGLLTIGISGYYGIGGGLSLSFGTGGWGLCGEAGVGIGGGVEADALSGPQNSSSFVVEGSLKASTLGVAIGAEATDCPESNTEFNSKAYIKGSYGVGQASLDTSDGLNGGLAPPPEALKAEAKVAGKLCWKWSYPWD